MPGEISAAERVWGTYELREEILQYLSRKDFMKLLCVSNSTFDEVVEKAWHTIDYKILKNSLVPVILGWHHYPSYLNAVKVVQFPKVSSDKVPVLSKWPNLLGAFPNAIEVKQGSEQILHRRLHKFKTGRSIYKYNFDHILSDDVYWERTDSDIKDFKIRDKSGIPKSWKINRKMHLSLSSSWKTRRTFPSFDIVVKEAIVKRVKSYDDELQGLTSSIPTSTSVITSALMDISKDCGQQKLPKSITLHYCDEGLLELCNFLAPKLRNISVSTRNYDQVKITAEQITHHINWDKFQNLEHLKISCRRDLQNYQNRRTSIWNSIPNPPLCLSSNVDVNKLPLPNIKSFEINILYPSRAELRQLNFTSANLTQEIEWIKKLAKLLNLITKPGPTGYRIYKVTCGSKHKSYRQVIAEYSESYSGDGYSGDGNE